MKVADFVINYLSDIGVDKVFVVYGAANGSLIDAFTRNDASRDAEDSSISSTQR